MAFRDGEPVRYGLVGSPDIVGFSEGGFFVGIEIKTGAGELRENQRNFRSICLMRGAVHIVGRDVDQVVLDLKMALRYKGVLLQSK